MRRNEREIKDQKVIEKWLKNSTICRVAFHDEEYPYIVPMNYGYSDNFLYFHCALEGRKLDLLRKNPSVGFEIEHQHRLKTGQESCSWTTHYQSLIGTGEIKIIDDHDAKCKALNILMGQHGKTDNSYPEKTVARMFVLQLDIHSISGKQSGDW